VSNDTTKKQSTSNDHRLREVNAPR
jgi:hypothetical protein